MGVKALRVAGGAEGTRGPGYRDVSLIGLWQVRIALVATVVLVVIGNLFWYVATPSDKASVSFVSRSLDPEHPCGHICAAVVCEALGIEWSFERIKRVVAMDAFSRTSMAELIDGLNRLGIAARGVEMPPRVLHRSSGPVILFVDDSHFLVAFAANSKMIALVDPPEISRTVASSDLEERWKGPAVLVARSRSELERMQADLGIAE